MNTESIVWRIVRRMSGMGVTKYRRVVDVGTEREIRRAWDRLDHTQANYEMQRPSGEVELRSQDALEALGAKKEGPQAIPMVLYCPKCNARHIDSGEFASKPHHTHACQGCGFVWRPAVVATVGVRFLPYYKSAESKCPCCDELLALLRAAGTEPVLQSTLFDHVGKCSDR